MKIHMIWMNLSKQLGRREATTCYESVLLYTWSDIWQKIVSLLSYFTYKSKATYIFAFLIK